MLEVYNLKKRLKYEHYRRYFFELRKIETVEAHFIGSINKFCATFFRETTNQCTILIVFSK